MIPLRHMVLICAAFYSIPKKLAAGQSVMGSFMRRFLRLFHPGIFMPLSIETIELLG